MSGRHAATDDREGARFVRPLHGVSADELASVGGKAVGLGTLIAAGVPVAEGVVVTTDAYRVVTAPLQERIERLAAGGDVAAAGAAIRGLVASAAVPPDLADEIRAAATAIGGRVAVRSSATTEDVEDSSAAGQQDTFLGPRGAEEVLTAVRACWASLWTDRAMAYRAQHGVAPTSRPSRSSCNGSSRRARRACCSPRIRRRDAATSA